MNENDIKERIELERNIQVCDYKLHELNAMKDAIDNNEYHAMVQIDCYGKFCGFNKEYSEKILNYAIGLVMEERAAKVKELDKHA